MGVYLSKANTEKSSEHGGHPAETDTRYGLTSMQGWRQSMEDAHLAQPSVKDLEAILGREVGLYGVFDGHGGPAVSAWIAKHMIAVLKDEVQTRKEQLVKKNTGSTPADPKSASSDGANASQFDDDVVILSDSLCRTFVQLDEEMQTPENLEELRVIHECLQAKRTPVDDERTGDSQLGDTTANRLKALLSSQSRSLLQAFLTRPVNDQDGGMQMFQNAAPEDFDTEEKHPMTIEEIVEDPHVTAPESKNPLIAEAVAEVAVEGGCDTENPTPAEVLNAAAKQLNETPPPSTSGDEQPPSSGGPPASDECDDDGCGGSGDLSTGELHPQLSVDDSQMRMGIPETCGAAVVVCAVVGGEKPVLITANAGDSRCVLCRNGVAIAQSHDHKPYLINEMNRIQNAGGYLEHGRVDGNLNLSRTLGDLFYKRNKALKPEQQKITAYPDIIVTPITPQDDFIIIACDGIWDCLTNQQACNFVASRLGEDPTPERLSLICEDMCDSCLAGNPVESDGGIGCDNMTCIIVLLNERYKKNGTMGEASSTYYQKSAA